MKLLTTCKSSAPRSPCRSMCRFRSCSQYYNRRVAFPSASNSGRGRLEQAQTHTSKMRINLVSVCITSCSLTMFGCFNSRKPGRISLVWPFRDLSHEHKGGPVRLLTFHQADLPDGRTGCAFLCVQVNLFERDDLLGRPRSALRTSNSDQDREQRKSRPRSRSCDEWECQRWIRIFRILGVFVLMVSTRKDQDLTL